MLKKIIIAILIMMTTYSIFCSCDSDPSPFEKVELAGMKESNKINSRICYTDEEVAIFSSGIRNNAVEGPLIDTKHITIYDLSEQKYVNDFDVNGENSIYHIVPYKDGILYASYDFEQSLGTCEWKITYRDEERKEVIDKGKCPWYGRIPGIILIDGEPVYLFENAVDKKEKDASYTCGVRRISGFKAETIMETDDIELLETTLESNGKEYFFLAEKDQNLYCYIGNLNDVDQSFAIEERIGSFAINDCYVAISIEVNHLTDGEDSYQLLTYDLESGQVKKYDTKEFLYRLKGGNGKSCVCVDWTFTPYRVNLENGVLEKIDLPKDIDEGTAVRFMPLSETTYLAEFLLEGNDTAYYKVEVK